MEMEQVEDFEEPKPSVGPVPQYFPDDGDINFWTFAMFAISSTFLIFVGFSIVIMCKGDKKSTVPRPRNVQ